MEAGAGNGRLLRLVGWTVLLAVVMLSLPSLRLALAPAPALFNGDELYLPILLVELNGRGYLRLGSRSVFLGNAAGSWAPFLEQHHVTPVSAGQLQEIHDQSVNLALVDGDGVGFNLINRILKVGGVAAAFGSSESTLQLPDNYKVVFAHHAKAVAFAVEKTGASTSAVIARPHRKLLALPGNKKEALAGLEGVLLEPPQKRHIIRRLRPKYLPELTGDSLEGYRRRVFIDVTPLSGGGAASWFKKHYPRGKHEFEIVCLKVAPEAAGAHKAAEGIGDWLEGNVREEDYVVVKAGVEAAEEMLRKGSAAVRRVDELFLDCGGEDDVNAGRPYWQCLALYGRLRDQGVAVHQWWGSMIK